MISARMDEDESSYSDDALDRGNEVHGYEIDKIFKMLRYDQKRFTVMAVLVTYLVLLFLIHFI